jgi:hypothetical protein
MALAETTFTAPVFDERPANIDALLPACGPSARSTALTPTVMPSSMLAPYAIGALLPAHIDRPPPSWLPSDAISLPWGSDQHSHNSDLEVFLLAPSTNTSEE